MRKEYSELELEIVEIATEDIITTSTFSFGDGILDDENRKEWGW